MTDKFVPESVLAKLVVGQRVRYVPDGSGGPTLSDSPAGIYGATRSEAYADAEGETGTIVSDAHIGYPNHPYQILMDKPYRFGTETFEAITTAAHELALIED